VDDVRRAKESGRLGVFFDIEGRQGDRRDQISLIRPLLRFGVRWMLMAYNLPNRVGGGCMEEGRRLTSSARSRRRMARVGMITCCSHTGERTALESSSIRRTRDFSHSNPRALWDHPRKRARPRHSGLHG